MASTREPVVARRPRSTSIRMMDKHYLDGRRKYGAHFAGGTPANATECGKTVMIGYVYLVAYRGD